MSQSLADITIRECIIANIMYWVIPLCLHSTKVHNYYCNAHYEWRWFINDLKSTMEMHLVSNGIFHFNPFKAAK